MLFPDKPSLRRDFAIEIGRQCSTSRPVRQAYNRDLRSYYVNGAADGSKAIYNKLKAHIKKKSAYLYQADSVRFGIVAPVRYGNLFDMELETARDDFHRFWHDGKFGHIISKGVKWAQVYPCSVFKVTVQAGEPVISLAPDPADIGVWEEDREFDRQEALVHFFPMNMAKMRRLLRGHPREKELLRKAFSYADVGAGSGAMDAVAPVMLFDKVGNPMEGGGALVQGPATVEALVDTARVLCAELWVVDDRAKDWRVFTCLSPDGDISDVLWEVRSPVLSGIDPFVLLGLDEPPDYTWGFSSTDDLSGLQDWRERRMRQIDQLLELQLDPPIVLGGFGGLSEERAERLRKPGGTLATSIPNPSVNRNVPQMPTEAFAEVDAIDRQFNDQGGLPNPLGQAGEPGQREIGSLAMLAAAEIREEAMRVEHCVSELATLVWRLHRVLEDEPLMKPDGSRFLLTQLPRDCVALVSAHSASPIFSAAVKQDAAIMRKFGDIDGDEFVSLMDPPGVDVLRAKARRIQEGRAKQQAELLEIKKMQALHGRSRSR